MGRNKSKKSKLVKFDKEIVTKDAAQDILSKLKQNESNMKNHGNNEKTVSNIINNDDNFENQSNRKRKKRKKLENQSDGPDKDNIEKTQEKPERKKKKRNQQPTAIEESSEVDQEQPSKETTESKRALKRKRKAQLFEENRLKHELSMQQQSLNYLSKWKHSRDDWKFEKLRQVWLQHNMFDIAKIPNEFWTILVEYFTSAKGQVRKTILDEAIKLIEKENEEGDENNDERVRIQRARDIVQSLQE